MTKMGVNQFTSPTPVSAFEAYMERGKHAETMRKLHASHQGAPNLCLYHGNLEVFWLRHEGKRHKFTPRQMVYYIEHGTTPPLGKTSCGNNKCTNPAHQNVLQKRTEA